MGEAKINIKVGHVEFSGEGEQEWLSEQLSKILKKVPEVLKMEVSTFKSKPDQKEKDAPSGPSANASLSMINIAAKLGVKSGSDLIMAAACFLRFSQGKATFRREDILIAMKDATGYYKKLYSKNLSRDLTAALKNNKLTQSADNAYSLHINKENELNAIFVK